jgi:hypothetical protein
LKSCPIKKVKLIFVNLLIISLSYLIETNEIKKPRRNSLSHVVSKRFSLPNAFSKGDVARQGDASDSHGSFLVDEKDTKPRLSRKAIRKSEQMPNTAQSAPNPEAITNDNGAKFSEKLQMPSLEVIAEKKYRRRSLPKPIENPNGKVEMRSDNS